MGQMIEFFGGDPKVVGAAVTALEFEKLDSRELIPLHVDFSLHLSPGDFDFLTEVVVAVVGSGPSGFLDCLTENVGGTEGESSADVVSSEWVRLMAALPEGDVRAAASKWAEVLAREYGDSGIFVTDEMVSALLDLVALCKDAVRLNVPVVHVWSL